MATTLFKLHCNTYTCMKSWACSPQSVVWHKWLSSELVSLALSALLHGAAWQESGWLMDSRGSQRSQENRHPQKFPKNEEKKKRLSFSHIVRAHYSHTCCCREISAKHSMHNINRRNVREFTPVFRSLIEWKTRKSRLLAEEARKLQPFYMQTAGALPETNGCDVLLPL